MVRGGGNGGSREGLVGGLAVGSCSWHGSAKPLLIINLGSSDKKRRVSTFRSPLSLVLVLSFFVCVWGGNVPLSALFGFPAEQGKLKFLP